MSPLLAIWRIRQVTASTSYAFAKNAHRRESRRCESTPKLPSAHVLVRNKVPSACKVKSSVTRRVRLRLLRGSKYARLATYTVGSSVHTCHSATCATVFSVLTILSSQQKKKKGSCRSNYRRMSRKPTVRKGRSLACPKVFRHMK